MSRNYHEYGYMPRYKLQKVKQKLNELISLSTSIEYLTAYIVDLFECDKVTERQFNNLMQIINADYRKVKWEYVILQDNYKNPLM